MSLSSEYLISSAADKIVNNFPSSDKTKNIPSETSRVSLSAPFDETQIGVRMTYILQNTTNLSSFRLEDWKTMEASELFANWFHFILQKSKVAEPSKPLSWMIAGALSDYSRGWPLTLL